MAGCLFALGLAILFVPIPNVGRIAFILYSTPLFLVLLGGWYLGRSGLATLSHLRQRRRFRTDETGTPVGEATATPSVSILIPAYNESRTIGETIRSVASLDYGGVVEIVVVDDGSTDGTWYALETLTDAYSNLRVVRQENAGSAAARNTALEHARNEVVISLDADTVLHPNAITEICRHFTSDDVVAVGGNVSVENMGSNWFAKVQVFDYALAMEMGRMFQNALGFVLCLSGAFGAFRREELLEAGGWNTHWLYSDDFEVSIRIQQYGDVRYTSQAIADTEVPTTFRGWFKQRSAWAQRGVSVMLLHWKKQFNTDDGMVGLVGLPLRAILTSLIIIKTVTFVGAMATGKIPVVDSLIYVFGVGLLGMTGLCALMLGILTVLQVNPKPIRYGFWVLGYLTIYRPLHIFVRLHGFAKALWWELSSFGGSLQADPEDYHHRRTSAESVEMTKGD
jgi:cellulose synthase/poly-beta-1,6-N-acetylglucosamine synthase-like glycosyltransferase